VTARSALPPGPRQPSALQTIGWWTRPSAFLERSRARYGKRFTIRLLAGPPFVIHSEPEHIKEIFSAPPDVLHPGEGAAVLEPVVGKKSVILLDEAEHLEQRKLMLPAFHGERMQRLSGLMTDVAERELATWPTNKPTPLHPRVQSLTLEIILRTVFGLDPGRRLDQLRELLTGILEFSTKPASVIPVFQRGYFGRGPWVRFAHMRERADELLYELVDERRGEGADRDDVLAMLLAARHEDGSPMSDTELRDELMTLLTAGHETTASELAWAFERLVREPRVLDRLVAEVDSGEGDRSFPTPSPGWSTSRSRSADGSTSPGPASSPTPTWSITIPTSIRTPTRSGPTAFSRTRPGPIRGSRSEAGAGGASARASPPWR
jgi:cytochrome P450